MNKLQEIEAAILAALLELGPSTARQVEMHPGVALACREAKIKARHRLEMMMLAGKVKSDRAYQGAKFWC
jgi:hypothetical protein